MKKLFLLCPLILALLGAGAPLSVHVDAQRASLDLLDPVAFVITVNNSSKEPVIARFPTATLYDIAVTSGTKEIWRWSTGHVSAEVLRSFTFSPGKTVIGTYVWDALADARSLAPGEYRAHISIADLKYHPSADLPLRFAVPLPVSAAYAVPVNTAVTVSGTLRPRGSGIELVDRTGPIRLSKRIAMQAPLGTFIVRGYLTKAYGETFLTVDRWARAVDNIEPTPGPAPVPTRMPLLPSPRKTPTP